MKNTNKITSTATTEQKVKKRKFAEVRVAIFKDRIANGTVTIRDITREDPNTSTVLSLDEQQEISKTIQAGIVAKIALSQIDDSISIQPSIVPDVPYIESELSKQGISIDENDRKTIRKCHALIDASNDARNFFATKNLGLAILLATREKNKRGLDVETWQEITEEAKIGLLFAVDKFNPESGYKFSTFATYWINQKMFSYLDDKTHLIKMSSQMNAIFKNIKFAEKELRNIYSDDRDITNERIYEWLEAHNRNVTLEDIEHAQSIRKETISLESVVSDETNKTISDVIATDEDTLETMMTNVDSNNNFMRLVNILDDEKQRNILMDWYAEEHSKEQALIFNLAKKYGMSKEELIKTKAAAEANIRKKLIAGSEDEFVTI